jgi:hypothetical protein
VPETSSPFCSSRSDGSRLDLGSKESGFAIIHLLLLKYESLYLSNILKSKPPSKKKSSDSPSDSNPTTGTKRQPDQTPPSRDNRRSKRTKLYGKSREGSEEEKDASAGGSGRGAESMVQTLALHLY